MQNFSFKTSKGDMLKSMMRHPDNSKLIKEALSSPLGSTSRAKAQKIFSIMNKLHTSYDGAGGPGMMYSQMSYGQQSTEMESPQANPKGMVVFHKIPKPKITYGKRAPKPQDGSGGPGRFDGQGGYFDSYFSKAANAVATPFTDLLKGGTGSSTSNIASTSPSSMSTTTQAYKAPAPVDPSYTPGVIQPGKLAEWGLGLGAGVVKAGVGVTGGVLGAGEYVAKNLGQGYMDLSRYLWGGSGPTKGPGYTSFSDTFGNKLAQEAWGVSSSPSKPSAQYPNLAGTKPVTQGTATSTSQAYGPIQQSGTTTPATNGLTTSGGATSGATSQWPAAGKTSGGASSQAGATTGGGASAGYSTPNIAAKSIAALLNTTVDAATSSVSTRDLAIALAKNEGFLDGTSTIAISHNNPGNLKFVGQAGATQGQAASDGGYFAKFATVDDGWNAMQKDLEGKISSGDPRFATIEGLMNVWSPNSGNPANTGGGSTSSGGNTTTAGLNADGTYTSPTIKYTGLAGKAQDAVANSMGAGLFARENNPLPTGSKLEKSMWDKFNIGGQKDEVIRMQKEGAELPKNVTAYITARDQYLNQTDQEIDRFINESMTGTAMSNPANVAKASSQLNYLYTLRGRQNQTYIGYLNDAVSTHQQDLDTMSKNLTADLASYEQGIARGDIDYNNMNAALVDTYTAVEGAPLKALQMAAYAQQMIDAHATVVGDNLKNSQQAGWMEQYAKLKSADFVDSEGRAISGTDLMQTVWNYKESDPQITSNNIIRTYVEGVKKYLNAKEEEKDTTGTGITSSKKSSMAKEALQQLAYLAGSAVDDPATQANALSAMDDVGGYLSALETNSFINSGTVPQVMEAVKDLAPGASWYTLGMGGPKTPPTEEEFTKTVVGKTGDPLSESIAKAIYAIFKMNVEDDGNKVTSPQQAIMSMLYPVGSTGDWDTAAPYTAEQFARRIYGEAYVEMLKNKAFTPEL